MESATFDAITGAAAPLGPRRQVVDVEAALLGVAQQVAMQPHAVVASRLEAGARPEAPSAFRCGQEWLLKPLCSR